MRGGTRLNSFNFGFLFSFTIFLPNLKRLDSLFNVAWRNSIILASQVGEPGSIPSLVTRDDCGTLCASNKRAQVTMGPPWVWNSRAAESSKVWNIDSRFRKWTLVQHNMSWICPESTPGREGVRLSPSLSASSSLYASVTLWTSGPVSPRVHSVTIIICLQKTTKWPQTSS